MKKFNILILLFFVLISESQAINTIQINRGNYKPTPIAINFFEGKDKIAEEIRDIVSKDLNSCGLFRTVSSAAFIDNKIGFHAEPLFPAWRQINSAILVNASVKNLGRGKMEVSFIVWDCFSQKDIAGEILEFPTKLWRKVAHKIADQIYERVTGDKGYFDTKIAYVSETGPVKRRIKRLAIMDQDGANHHFLTNGKNLVLTPRFSPKGDKILYLSYIKGSPKVFLKDLASGREMLLGNFPGMSFAPRFSPDGSKALISVAKNGATNIWEIDLYDMTFRKLTNSTYAINTSATYTPDGKKIVFNSDRGGTRQIYMMNNNGTNIRRISAGTGGYATPVVSPRGDYIAFTKVVKGQGFYIGVMKIDGTGERLISNHYIAEGPTWSANGRVIIYSSASRPNKNGETMPTLRSIDLTGYNERIIETPLFGSDPEWSGLDN